MAITQRCILSSPVLCACVAVIRAGDKDGVVVVVGSYLRRSSPFRSRLAQQLTIEMGRGRPSAVPIGAGTSGNKCLWTSRRRKDHFIDGEGGRLPIAWATLIKQ